MVPNRLYIIVLILLQCGMARAELQQTWSFEDIELGMRPDKWEIAETQGRGVLAVWEVTSDAEAPGGRAFGITNNRNRGTVGNLVFVKTSAIKNVELSTYIKAGPAGQDTGGGLIWRAVNEKFYYLAQWNPNDKNLRLYVVADGKPSLLESVSLDADPSVWHQMAVTHFEESIEVSFDGNSMITVEDKQLDFPGWVGLWAPGSAMPLFDEVNLYTEEEGAEGNE